MMNRRTQGACWGLALIAPLALSATLVAQDVSGSISGTVRDASGAVIPNATVKLTNTDRNLVVRTLTTSSSGTYTARSLPLGNYTVEVSANSFSTKTVSGIVLHVNDTLTINADLNAGGGNDTVTVTSEQQNVNMENATQAGLINGTQVRELVLSSRNYEQLVGLQPGVAYSGGDQIYIGNSSPSGATNVVNFSVNGTRTSGNAWTVDGADNVDRGSNYTLLTYPSVDAIAEFKTLRGQYSAEFGRAASGQINVVTKSGTNSLHGSLYEFVRNDVFNANDTLNKLTTTPAGATKTPSARGKLRYNDFGGTIGGPVFIPKVYDGRKHKTYFFYSQEVRRVLTYKPVTLTGVPTLLERQGIFNVPVCASYNGTTGTCTSTSTTVPITSNMAKAYLKDIYAGIPQPSTDGTGTLVLAPQRNVFNANQQIGRIDQSFGEKVQVFFRIINDDIPTIEPFGLFGNGAAYAGVNTTQTNAPGRIYLGHATYTITPTLLLDGGYAYSQGALLSDPIGTARNAASPDVATAAKLPYTSTLPRVPALTFQGGTGITTYGPYRDYSRNHNVFANVTKSMGAHTLRFGVDYNHYEKKENNASANAGSFSFTAPTGETPTGSKAQPYQQAFANFLSNYVTTFSQASYDVTADIQVHQFEAYAQDDWKLNPRLTVNFGLRYSKFNQPIDGNHQLSTFDPSLYVAANAPTIDKSNSGNLCVPGAPCMGVTPNPSANLLNGISINKNAASNPYSATGNSPYGTKVGSSDNANFAPRVGFAFDVFGNGKTSLRGGYGIAYDSALFGIYEQNIFQNIPFINTPVINNTSFDNPAAVAATVSYAAPVIRATSPHFSTPYNQQWSLGVQSGIGLGVTVDVSYVGNHQVHLLGFNDINQPAPGAFAAAKLGTPGAGGTYSVNSTTINQINQIRPYRGYGVIESVNPIYSGNYNALQVAGRKQWKHDSLVQVNYTWSRALTNAAADRTGGPQIASNLYAEYGRAAADRTHMLNFNAVYALPFFYEQKGLVGHLLGGWEASALGFFNSGLPLTPTTSGLDPAGVGVIISSATESGRPDQVGNPNVASAASGPIHNRLHWYNINAFQAVPQGQYRGGNAARSTINGPGWWRVDAGLFRNIRIYERLNLQLRGEAFNLFNHTNPDGVTTGSIISASGYSSTAGNITSYRDKRILQLGAKLVF